LLTVAQEGFMSLKGTYAYSVDMAQKLGLQGSIEERDGKLHFKGTVANQADANRIWDAIKTIPTWSQDVVADIQARPGAEQKTYTVKAGDTLSKIAKELLGDANAYHKIFDANRDQLSDPNKIMPGQQLKIPA
jgi:nucleoid-associated protein YgaU